MRSSTRPWPQTRHELQMLLSPEAAVTAHERQRALVHASVIAGPPEPRRPGGWVPG